MRKSVPTPQDIERIVAKAAVALREDYGRYACREAFERVLLMLAIDSRRGFQIWLHVGWRLASPTPSCVCTAYGCKRHEVLE